MKMTKNTTKKKRIQKKAKRKQTRMIKIIEKRNHSKIKIKSQFSVLKKIMILTILNRKKKSQIQLKSIKNHHQNHLENCNRKPTKKIKMKLQMKIKTLMMKRKRKEKEILEIHLNLNKL